MSTGPAMERRAEWGLPSRDAAAEAVGGSSGFHLPEGHARSDPGTWYLQLSGCLSLTQPLVAPTRPLFFPTQSYVPVAQTPHYCLAKQQPVAMFNMADANFKRVSASLLNPMTMLAPRPPQEVPCPPTSDTSATSTSCQVSGYACVPCPTAMRGVTPPFHRGGLDADACRPRDPYWGDQAPAVPADHGSGLLTPGQFCCGSSGLRARQQSAPSYLASMAALACPGCGSLATAGAPALRCAAEALSSLPFPGHCTKHDEHHRQHVLLPPGGGGGGTASAHLHCPSLPIPVAHVHGHHCQGCHCKGDASETTVSQPRRGSAPGPTDPCGPLHGSNVWPDIPPPSLVNGASAPTCTRDVASELPPLGGMSGAGGAGDRDGLPPIGVFWDIENCSVPTGRSAMSVAQRVRQRLFGGHREAEFLCVCDISKEKREVIQELNNAQVTVVHINATAKNAADDKLKQSMRRFAETHSAPATIVLISSDVNFALEMSDLRHRHGFTVVLVHKTQASSALMHHANTSIRYEELVDDLPPCPSPQPCHTLLYINNLPSGRDTRQVGARLRQLSENCGGKVLSVAAGTACLRFPSPARARRAQRRLDNEDVYGSRISASFLPQEDGGGGSQATEAAAALGRERLEGNEKPRSPGPPAHRRGGGRRHDADDLNGGGGGGGGFTGGNHHGSHGACERDCRTVEKQLRSPVAVAGGGGGGGRRGQRRIDVEDAGRNGAAVGHSSALPLPLSSSSPPLSTSRAKEQQPRDRAGTGTGAVAAAPSGQEKQLLSGGARASGRAAHRHGGAGKNPEAGDGGAKCSLHGEERAAGNPKETTSGGRQQQAQQPSAKRHRRGGTGGAGRGSSPGPPATPLLARANAPQRGGRDTEITRADSCPPLVPDEEGSEAAGKPVLVDGPPSGNPAAFFRPLAPTPPPPGAMPLLHASHQPPFPIVAPCPITWVPSSRLATPLNQLVFPGGLVSRTTAVAGPPPPHGYLPSPFGYGYPGSGVSPTDVLISNLDGKAQWSDIMQELSDAFAKFGQVKGIELRGHAEQQQLRALVRMGSAQEAALSASALQHCQVTGRRVHVSLASDGVVHEPQRTSPLQTLRLEAMGILHEAPGATLPLHLFAEVYEKRYGRKLVVSDLHKLTDSLCVHDHGPACRLVSLLPLRNGPYVGPPPAATMAAAAAAAAAAATSRERERERNFSSCGSSPVVIEELAHHDAYCPVHSPHSAATVDIEEHDLEVEYSQLPFVVMSLKTFAAQVHALLHSHDGTVPLLSFPDCYEAEMGPLPRDAQAAMVPTAEGDTAAAEESDDAVTEAAAVAATVLAAGCGRGVPLEHLAACVQGVHVVMAQNGVKVVKWVQNKPPPPSSDTWLASRCKSPVGNPQLIAFAREVVELLRTQPRCLLAFTRFIPAYHHHFGKQCRVAEYGYARLGDLLDAVPHVLQILGLGGRRLLTLTHRVQVKRFTQDLLKLLKSQASKQVCLQDFAQAYHWCFSREWDVREYGMCELSDLLAEVPDAVVAMTPQEGGPVLSIPIKVRTEEERSRTRVFAREVVKLLRQMPRGRMAFSRFIPAYHHHYGRQCKLAHYGFTKLTDLFEAIPEVVTMLERGEDKLLVLTETEQLKALACQISQLLRVHKDQPHGDTGEPAGAAGAASSSFVAEGLAPSELPAEYARAVGHPLYLQDYDVSSVTELLSKIPHVVKVVDTPVGRRIQLLCHKSQKVATTQLLLLLMSQRPGALVKLALLEQLYHAVFGAPLAPHDFGFLCLADMLRTMHSMFELETESGTAVGVRLTPLLQFAACVRALLLTYHYHQISLADFPSAYAQFTGNSAASVASTLGFGSLEEALLAFPQQVVWVKKHNKMLVLKHDMSVRLSCASPATLPSEEGEMHSEPSTPPPPATSAGLFMDARAGVLNAASPQREQRRGQSQRPAGCAELALPGPSLDELLSGPLPRTLPSPQLRPHPAPLLAQPTAAYSRDLIELEPPATGDSDPSFWNAEEALVPPSSSPPKPARRNGSLARPLDKQADPASSSSSSSKSSSSSSSSSDVRVEAGCESAGPGETDSVNGGSSSYGDADGVQEESEGRDDARGEDEAAPDSPSRRRTGRSRVRLAVSFSLAPL
ncbi:meiosis regulator and mRNA stability factor 1 isoform X1 [Petromyzon marinus]|uniref:meiosis regulator and mRNA stability factor 1 isoform X1 n=2 Tax=Petromyzon marinus TaxID=7757 RepID=UPI003F6F0D28